MNRGRAGILVLIAVFIGFSWLYNYSHQPDGGCSVPSAKTIPDLVAAAICNTSAAPTTTVSQRKVLVVYDLDPWLLTYSSARVSFYDHVEKIVPATFARFPIDSIEIVGRGRFKDIRGNESQQDAARIVFGRANAAAIKWDKINSENLPRLADSV